MAANRWDPFRDLLAIQNEMNRLFGRAYGGTSPAVPGDQAAMTAGEAADAPPDLRASWAPPLDVYETPQSVNIVVELPGVRAADVEITVDEEVLTVRGTRSFYEGMNEDAFHRIERRFGPFQRRITLPKQSDTDRISASMEDGLLTIEVPKVEQAVPRRIEVRATQ